jgi:2-dehydropantoate 2-reductase
MKILIYGAGVLGSVLAVKLKEANVDISILARGNRYDFIKNNGIIIEDFWSKKRTTSNVKVLDKLNEDDNYDLIMVIMPRINTPSVLPILEKNKNSPNILFIGNNVSGFDEYSNTLNKNKILLGFWLGSGHKEKQIVYYSDISSKGEKAKLIIGEHNRNITDRTKQIKEIIEKAGYPVDISENIDAWLKTHAMLISPFALGVSDHNFNNYELAKSNHTLKLVSKAIKEGIKALHKLNIPILPKEIRIIRFLPVFLLVKKYKSMIGSKYFEIASGHGKSAQNEMKYIAKECFDLIRKAKIKSSAFENLMEYL